MNPQDSHIDFDPGEDDPIPLAPDQDEDDRPVYRIKPLPQPSTAANAGYDDTVLDDQASRMRAIAPVSLRRDGEEAPLSQTLRWALDSLHEPAMAAADWLARDIDPGARSAAEFLCNPNISLTHVRQAKSVFKTMRIVGEKSADRRVGARMYAAAIAAALVRHGKRISTQSDAALKRGFTALLEDRRMPQPLRELGGLGLCALQNQAGLDSDANPLRSKSA